MPLAVPSTTPPIEAANQKQKRLHIDNHPNFTANALPKEPVAIYSVCVCVCLYCKASLRVTAERERERDAAPSGYMRTSGAADFQGGSPLAPPPWWWRVLSALLVDAIASHPISRPTCANR